MKEKIANKIAEMRNSDKKGMEVLGWILTIVLTIAVVGIIWFFVQPAVNDSADKAADNLETGSGEVVDNAISNVTEGMKDTQKPASKPKP